ncbi:hypothetical protein ABEO98_22545 [Brevibacillus parabrevis]|uniref:hypothetical protein n=1 Tax=Brevibacillus parabrevis TaxID=54914 RepID=UPI00249124A0|nr:hypothetical protein [Brevibacillus parabrevis]
MDIQQVISQMPIAEIQRTFGISQSAAIRLKKGLNVQVDFRKTTAFFEKKLSLRKVNQS